MNSNHLILLFVITFFWKAWAQNTICTVCTCKGNEINCKNHQLNYTFEISEWNNIGKVKNFTEAHFDNNHIRQITKFPNLTLIVLSFHNNRIIKIDDRAFIELTNLEQLDLSRNELTSDNLLPSVFEVKKSDPFFWRMFFSFCNCSAANNYFITNKGKLKIKILSKNENMGMVFRNDFSVPAVCVQNLLTTYRYVFWPSLRTLSRIIVTLTILTYFIRISFYRILQLNVLLEIGPFDSINYEPLMLKTLDLSSNELHTLHQDLFEHLPHLRRLYLKRNPFKILDKPTVIAISSLPNLEVLDLSYTKIKALPPGFLHTPKKLHELVLRGNNFNEVPSDVLVESHDLRILNLNENPIPAITTEKPFPEMPTLRQLHLSFMPNLTRIEDKSLNGLKNLEFFYCRMNMHLKYISGKAFAQDEMNIWPNLTKLDLSDNALRYLDHDFLKPFWTTMTYLNIMGNPLVCDCENQWMVTDLVPLLIKISSPVDGLDCSEPSAMRGRRFITLHSQNSSMRCMDYYDNHPEKDGPILISLFVIIILTLIIILVGVLWLRRNEFFRPGARNYQRAFYRPAKIDDADRY